MTTNNDTIIDFKNLDESGTSRISGTLSSPEQQKSTSSTTRIGRPMHDKQAESSPQQQQNYGEENEQDGLFLLRQTSEPSADYSVIGGSSSATVGGVINNNQSSSNKWMKLCIGLILVSCLIYVIVDTMNDKRIETSILSFLEWVEQNPYQGMVAVVLVYIVATILFVPGSILTLGTGYAFGSATQSTALGVMLASTSVFIGASMGSICSFLLGRYLFRDCVVHLASNYPIFRAVDRALQGNGLKIMILLRLSPLIPYNALDYMSGITAIPLWSYTVALVGILPGTIVFCFVGASASSLAEASSGTSSNNNDDTDGGNINDHETIRILTIVFGVVFAFIGVYVASYYSKLELDRILASEEIQEDGLNRSPASLPLRRDISSGDGVLEEPVAASTVR